MFTCGRISNNML